MDELSELAVSAARDAGACLRDGFLADAGIRSEAGNDIKTEADEAADRVILKALKGTGLPILSEETGVVPATQEHSDGPTIQRFNHSTTQLLNLPTPIWIIDPLDGTFNFTRGFPVCCVSIALWDDGVPVFGVIYDFVEDRLYQGRVGHGAWEGDAPICVSSITDPARAALATGFPSARDYSDASLADSVRRVQRFKKIRMIGSAAMSLAHVAAGRVDAYYEESIWLWDVAAGLALVQAAGGAFQLSEIGADWKLDVFAGNGKFAVSFCS